MVKKIIFRLDDDKYFINLNKGVLVITNNKKFTKELYHLDSIQFGDDWVVLEATLSK
ncbi:MAG: hypothetical protein RBR59_09220 [Sulfurimonadaceae bacterium]|jgi:hypothetical protein|nr:hypothetical protein [Sulfurimonadaceae bacterium]